MIWNTLSKLNDSLFKATGDIKYALLSLAAERRTTNTQTALVPVTVDHFRSALEEILETGGDIQDPMQKILNKSIAEYFLSHLREVRGEKSVFKAPLPSNPLNDLIPEVLPFDKDSMSALATHLKGKSYPTEEITSIVSEVADSKESLTNALSVVAALAFIKVYNEYLELNPALQFIGSALQKTAAEKNPDRLKTATLRDLIDAMNDAYAKYMHEYNILINANAMKNVPAAAEMLSGIKSEIITDQRLLTTKARNLAVLKAGYMRYYNDLQKALKDFANSPEFSHHVGTTDIDGIKFTSNPYILPDNPSFEGANSVSKLINAKRGLSALNIPITLWNGEKQAVKSLQAESEPIIFKKYMAPRSASDVATEILESAPRTIEKVTSQNSGPVISQIGASLLSNMVTPDRNIMPNIRADIISKCKESTKSINHDSPTYTNDLLAAFNSAKSDILSKYGSLFKNQQLLVSAISSVFNYFALPVSPHTTKHLRGSELISNYFYKSPQQQEELAQVIKSRLTSPEYVARYKDNEREYLSKIDNDATQMLKRMNSIKSSPELQKLFGVDTVARVAKQATQKALLGSAKLPPREAAGLIGQAINDIMDAVVSAYESAPETARSQVSLQDFISFMYKEYLSSTVEEYIDRTLQVMTSYSEQSVSNSEGESSSRSAAMEEVKRMVKDNMIGDLTPRASSKGGLFRASVYFILNKLFQDKYQKQSELTAKQKQYYESNKGVFDRISQISGAPISVLIDVAAGKVKASSAREAHPMLTKDMIQEIMPPADIRADFENISNNIARMTPAASLRYQVELNFGSVRSSIARSSVLQFLKQNEEDGVTNWSDKNNPRPRNYSELGHLCGAFADPLQALNGSQTDIKNATPRALLYKAITRSGADGLGDNPVFKIRDQIDVFKKEILEANSSLANCIVPFDINSKRISFDDSPFLPGGALHDCLDVGVSFESDVLVEESPAELDPKQKLISKAIEQYEQVAAKDPTISGLSENIKMVLNKLPMSQLTDQRWMGVVEAVVGKNLFADELTSSQQQILDRFNSAVAELNKIKWEPDPSESATAIVHRKNKLADLAKNISQVATLSSIKEGKRPSVVTRALDELPEVQKQIYQIGAQLNAPRLSTKTEGSLYDKVILPTIQFVGKRFDVTQLLSALEPVKSRLTQEGAVKLATAIRAANGDYIAIINDLSPYISGVAPRRIEQDIIEIFDESAQPEKFTNVKEE